MITIRTTVYARGSKLAIGWIARQGCMWEAFRPGQPEPFFYASSQRDVLDELRRSAPTRPARA